jgi:hypothetical protein
VEKREKRGKRKENTIGNKSSHPCYHTLPQHKEDDAKITITQWKEFFGMIAHVMSKYSNIFSHANVCIARTILFVLYVYPNFYIFFIFNFISLKLNCFSRLNFILFCKTKHHKFPFTLQDFRIKATKIPTKSNTKLSKFEWIKLKKTIEEYKKRDEPFLIRTF